jgi:hypothetical protein
MFFQNVAVTKRNAICCSKLNKEAGIIEARDRQSQNVLPKLTLGVAK